MKENDTNVFKGHRERMRRKLRAFGTRVFETYELIEMLLFSVIPRRNTHPTAKLLLREFTSLDALFSSDKEKLSKIAGIGDECAQFLYDVGSFLNHNEENGQSLNKKFFESYEDKGAFFADYFKSKSTCETVVLLLDSKLAYIDVRKVYSLDLSSGAVQAKPFIDAALQKGATLCAVAHNHPHSSPYPTEGDWESAKALKSAFSEAGLVSGGLITPEGREALEPYRVKRALFMAAGFGSRLVPITLNTPKPLVRVHGVRMIDTLLDAVLAAGITEIYVIRGYLSEQFDQLFYKYPMIKFIENPLFKDGFVDVPNKPGLGIDELNEELIADHIHDKYPGIWESTDEWNNEWANDREWS